MSKPNINGAALIAEAKQEVKVKEKAMKTKLSEKTISLKTLVVTTTALVLGCVVGYLINDVVDTVTEAKAHALVTTLAPQAKEVSKQ